MTTRSTIINYHATPYELFKPALTDVSFAGIWVTANPLKAAGHFSVFEPIFISIIIIHSLELFTSAFADSFSLETE